MTFENRSSELRQGLTRLATEASYDSLLYSGSILL